MPRREPERYAEILRRRAYLPPDLHDDPAFAVSSNQWHTWRRTETSRSRTRRRLVVEHGTRLPIHMTTTRRRMRTTTTTCTCWPS
jgi:hypothetical protein